MIYAKVEGGAIVKYPYQHRNLKEDNPHVSFPRNPLDNESIRSGYDVVEVIPVSPANKLGWHSIEEDPSSDGSVWSQNWKYVVKDVDKLRNDEILPTEPPVEDGYTATDGVPELIDDKWYKTWVMVKNNYTTSRMKAYGMPEEQIEFITENGLEAWQTKVAEIKTTYPKP